MRMTGRRLWRRFISASGKARAKSVLTIHNLAFQGQFPSKIFSELRLPPSAFAIDGVEYYGAVGFLKGGLASADAITTVSPTYAAEIATPEYGMGLDGMIRARRSAVTGIVNGIDIETWDPATDAALPERYTAQRLARRSTNKRAIEQRFELERDDGPLFCVVSRLTWQKGMDILADTLDSLVAHGARLALLGSGEAWLEQAFAAAAQRHRGRIGVIAGYDENLVASAAGWQRCHPHPVALRAVRAHPALWIALWLRAGGGANRRPCRHDHRCQ